MAQLNYSIQTIANVLGAQCSNSALSNISIQNISFDSRLITIPTTTLFFCIDTATRSGTQFIPQLYSIGVRAFVVHNNFIIDSILYPEAHFIKVTHTVSALQQLAQYHKQQFPNLITYAITGSNGKTTVKEWLYSILNPSITCVKSPKSYNSQIGVALSVCEINSSHKIGIFEAGISEPEEMEQLKNIIQPHIGIFTGIGDAHSEGFENLKLKIKEKLKLFTSCHTLIAWAFTPEVIEQIIVFSSQNPSINIIKIEQKATPYTTHFTSKKNGSSTQITLYHKSLTYTYTIPFADDAAIQNSILVYIAALQQIKDTTQLSAQMLHLTSVSMRLEIIKGKNNCTLINDTYNADLVSLRSALEKLNEQTQHTQKVLVVSEFAHTNYPQGAVAQIAEICNQSNLNILIGIGQNFEQNHKLFTTAQTHFFATTQQLLQSKILDTLSNSALLFKGSRTYQLEKLVEKLEWHIHQTELRINLSALKNNFKTIKAYLKPHVKTIAMVKAYSYGTGSVEIAHALQSQGVNYFAVAYTHEGIQLRQSGIATPIMVMNPEENSFAQLIQHQLEPEIYSTSFYTKFETAVKQNGLTQYPIHLKIETGMNRLGLQFNDLAYIVTQNKANNYLKIESVFSHLASSDTPEQDNYTQQQLQQFNQATTYLTQHGVAPFWTHIANSAAIQRFAHTHLQAVRMGIALYGISTTPTPWQPQLQTVATLVTQIVQIKNIEQGQTIGYNRIGQAPTAKRIAIVCVGYADGIARQLSNGAGQFWAQGHLLPIIGNVCMDMTMLDITPYPSITEGTEVEIFGTHQSINTLATQAHTIPYEIITRIPQRVKRIYFEE